MMYRSLLLAAAMLSLGYGLDAEAIGFDLVLDLESQAGTPESAVSAALDQLCPGLQQNGAGNADQSQLLALCDTFNNSATTPEERARVLKAVSSRSASSEVSVATYLPGGAGASIMSFVSSLTSLHQAADRDLAGISKPPFKPVMVASIGTPDIKEAADVPASRLSGFVNVSGIAFKQYESTKAAGFDGDGGGLAVGADYRINDDTFAGCVVRHNANNAALAGDTGKLEAANTGITLYGSYSLNSALVLDSVLSVGRQSYQLTRHIAFSAGGTAVNATARSEPSGSNLALNLGAGWMQNWSQGTNLDVAANLNYGSSTIDAFTEHGAGGYNLAVDKQTLNFLHFDLNVVISRPFSTRLGVVTPQVAFNGIHEFDDSGQEIAAHFIADPGANQFSFTTSKRDSDYFIGALGLSLLAAGGATAYLQYETLIGLDNYSQQSLTLGGRIEF